MENGRHILPDLEDLERAEGGGVEEDFIEVFVEGKIYLFFS
jgi:hypothetical protein